MEGLAHIRQLKGYVWLFNGRIGSVRGQRAYKGIACEFRQKRALSTERGNNENHYKNLNLAPSAKLREIKRSFKKLSMKLHPDKLRSQKLREEELERKKEDYMRIKRSYEVRSNPERKREYDRALATRQARTAQQQAVFKSRSAPGYHYTKYGERARMHGRAPDFNKERYFKWNMANEQRMRERKITQFGDLFHHDLNNIDLSLGVRKDLRRFAQEFDDKARQREMRFLRQLALTVVGLMALWELTLGQAWDAHGGKKAAKVSRDAQNVGRQIEPPQYGNNEYSNMIIANALGEEKEREKEIELKREEDRQVGSKNEMRSEIRSDI